MVVEWGVNSRPQDLESSVERDWGDLALGHKAQEETTILPGPKLDRERNHS